MCERRIHIARDIHSKRHIASDKSSPTVALHRTAAETRVADLPVHVPTNCGIDCVDVIAGPHEWIKFHTAQPAYLARWLALVPVIVDGSIVQIAPHLAKALARTLGDVV